MNDGNMLLFFEILASLSVLNFLATVFVLLKITKKMTQLSFAVKNMIAQSLKKEKDFDMESDLNNRLSFLQKSKFSPMGRSTTRQNHSNLGCDE